MDNSILPHRRKKLVLIFYLLATFLIQTEILAGANGSCPVTVLESKSVSGIPAGTDANYGWYGSTKLAVAIPKNGIWIGMGPEKNYGDKFWWWSDGYSINDYLKETLNLTVKKLNGNRESFALSSELGAQTGGVDLMLIGINFPSKGCWQIEGTYKDRYLQFVLQVGEKN